MNPFSSGIFYPKPDALRIFGKDNSSYWLMLFVRFDIESRGTLYHLGAVIEAAVLCISFFLYAHCIYLSWKHKILHSNFLAIMTNWFAFFQAGSLARVAMILYESGAISWSDISATPIPFFGTMRQNGLTQAFFILILITAERCFATLYVADYELRPRRHIPALIIITADIIILAISYAFVAGIFNGYICCIVGLLPNVGCVWILRQMLKRNKQILARLSDSLRRYPNDKYSLSLRVQLKENVWSLQKIEFGVFIVIIALVLNILISFGPVFILTQPAQMNALQWCMFTANVILAVSIACSAPMGYFAIALHTGARPFYVRWYLRKFANEIIVSPAEVKETEAYFIQLHSQWDYAMKTEKRVAR